MPVEIDQMTSRVEVLPAQGRGRPGAPGQGGAHGAAELVEALRPIVVQLIRAELEEYMRTRG